MNEGKAQKRRSCPPPQHPPPPPPPPPPPAASGPWLMFHHGHGRCMNRQTLYNHHHKKSYVRHVPLDFRKIEIWNSDHCHGWFILSWNGEDDDVHHLFLWNPITFESIPLPPLPVFNSTYSSKRIIDYCILSSPPTTEYPNSAVFLFDSANWHILFCRLNNNSSSSEEVPRWIVKSYAKQIEALIGGNHRDYVLRRPVICNGELYATLGKSTSALEDLVCIKNIEPAAGAGAGAGHKIKLDIKLLGTRLPLSYNHFSAYWRTDLLESCGDLFTINTVCAIRQREVIAIDIFKLDFPRMVWDKVKTAPDRAFFVCNRYAFSCPANANANANANHTTTATATAGNRVYFTRFWDKRLYSYDLDEESISFSLPCPNLRPPWSTPMWVWAMPDDHTWRLTKFCEEAIPQEERKEQEQASEEVAALEKYDKNTEKTVAAAETHNLVDLPFDILKSVSEQLSLVDYMNFRAVSTWCSQAAPPIKWRATMNGLKSHSLPPWLLAFQKNRGVCSLVDSKQGDTRYLVRIPESLQDATLCHCKDGWLLMCKWVIDEHFVIFYNPLSKDIIEYPVLPWSPLPFELSRFGFSSPPTSSNCVVVVVSFLYTTIQLHGCSSREDGWSSVMLECFRPFQPVFNIPVFTNGGFYFLGENGSLGVLRLEEHEELEEDEEAVNPWKWQMLEKPQKPSDTVSHNFLVESCDGGGGLLWVFIGHLGKEVEVFKLNQTTIAWERVNNLGKNILYLSRLSALSTVANSSEMEGKIYLPRFCGENLLSYSLSTGMYHSSGSGSKGSSLLEDYLGTREQLFCGWIEPRWY